MRVIFAASCFCLMWSCQINGKSHSFGNSAELTQDTLKCNIGIVAQLSMSVEKPDMADVLNFLYTFDETCSSNVEYREFSNEILFQVTQRHPDELLDLLSGNNDVKTYLILKELRYPISDANSEAEVSEVIKKIEIIEGNKK